MEIVEGDVSKVINLDDFRSGEYLFAALAVCMSEKWSAFGEYKGMCLHRWVAGVPKETSLFRLECPSCKCQDSFASILPSEYLSNFGVDE